MVITGYDSPIMCAVSVHNFVCVFVSALTIPGTDITFIPIWIPVSVSELISVRIF